MTKLDELGIQIELVLISLLEGIALLYLAQQAVHTLGDPEWYSYVTYILAGLAILLVFWTQSVLHALSFIRWPLRIEHIFLYFSAVFVQMVAYANLENITMWFFWWGLFSIITFGMYVIDLWVMRDSYKNFAKLAGGDAYLRSIEERHFFEMKFLAPAAFCFSVIVWLSTLVFPSLVEDPWVYAVPGLIQFGFSAYVLYDFSRTFKTRSAMIAVLFSREK